MTKVVYAISVALGSYLFGWMATLFGAGYFSAWGVIANAIGGFIGIYIGYKINTEYIG